MTAALESLQPLTRAVLDEVPHGKDIDLEGVRAIAKKLGVSVGGVSARLGHLRDRGLVTSQQTKPVRGGYGEFLVGCVTWRRCS